jgi:hypothetical protein
MHRNVPLTLTILEGEIVGLLVIIAIIGATVVGESVVGAKLTGGPVVGAAKVGIDVETLLVDGDVVVGACAVQTGGCSI